MRARAKLLRDIRALAALAAAEASVFFVLQPGNGVGKFAFKVLAAYLAGRIPHDWFAAAKDGSAPPLRVVGEPK